MITRMFATLDKREARHRKYKRLKLGGGQAYDPSSVYCRFRREILMIGHYLLY
jgi:hypothetical protein